MGRNTHAGRRSAARLVQRLHGSGLPYGRCHSEMRGLGCLPTDGSAAVWLPARQGLYCFLPDSADPAPGLLGPRALARRARPEARAEASCHAIPGQEGDTPDTPLIGRVPAGCGEFPQSPLEPSEGYPAAGHQASKRVFSSSFAPPCRRVDRPIPLLCTPLFLANLLLHLGLRPRWHAIEQHFFERPDMVGHSGRHRGRTRPPPLGGARAIRPDWLCQGLA
jgi:hypothetical protein